MRSILFSLGPWDWPALLGIAACLLVAVLAWRRIEVALGEHPAALNARWVAFAAPAIGLASGLVWLLVNRYGPLEIKSYGAMLVCGFVAGIVYCSRVGPQRGLNVPTIVDMALLQLILGIVGARGLFVLLELKQYAGSTASIVSVWRGGLSFHGGVIGAVIGTALFCRWRKARFAVLADVCTPALCLGYALTRIGCFLNGCCHGGPTTLPWGVVFPENIKDFPMPVQPTQLYASFGSLVLFFIVTRAWRHMHRPGQLFPLYLFLYSAILRFLCEYTRAGASAEMSTFIPSLTVAQVACILIAVGAAIWFLVLQRMPYENPLTAMAIQEPAPAAAPTKQGKKRK